MDLEPSEFDRLLFFEQARKIAEATYARNPRDADNLMRWSGALIELSHFQNLSDSKKMVEDAIGKLEEALLIDPKRHDVLWCIGNAYTSHGFLNPDSDEARSCFAKASIYFKQAVEEDPDNELYRKSVEITDKAPEIYADMNKQHGFVQQTAAAAEPSTSSSTKTSKKKKSSDLNYDIFGWIILSVGIVAWVGFAKTQVPPPPPPPR